MKKILSLFFAVLALCTSCRCHKKAAVVTVEPKFETEVVWKLTAVKGKKINYAKDQKIATIQFNPEAGLVSGCTGCNRFFGNFKDFGKGKMELSEISSTKMACPEPFMKVEGLYLPVLRKVDGYNLGEYQLELLQGDKVVLTFEKMEISE